MAVRSTQKAEGQEQTVKDAVETKSSENGMNNKAKKAEVMTIVYIGPTLPAGRLKSNRIMIGTMEEIKAGLEEVLKKYPLVEKMLVPVEELASKKDKVKTPGNIMNKYYSDIKSNIAAKEA